jgi:hypothetical protein
VQIKSRHLQLQIHQKSSVSGPTQVMVKESQRLLLLLSEDVVLPLLRDEVPLLLRLSLLVLLLLRLPLLRLELRLLLRLRLLRLPRLRDLERDLLCVTSRFSSPPLPPALRPLSSPPLTSRLSLPRGGLCLRGSSSLPGPLLLLSYLEP